MGQTAALLVALGPRVAEVDVQPVHLRRGKHIRQQGGVPHHEKYVAQPRRLRPFHGHHHGVRHLLHGDEQNIRLRLGRTHGEAPLAAAQFYPQRTGIGHQLSPVAPHGEGVLYLTGPAGLHPGQ